MSVDAVFARIGLKSVSRLHTSTFFDGKLEMDNGKLMTAELNVPKDTVDVLDVSVDFFTLQNEELKEIQSRNEVHKTSHNSPTYVTPMVVELLPVECQHFCL